MNGDPRSEVGRVIGYPHDSEPLQFWVGVSPESYLQLDDITAVTSHIPERGGVTHYGVVDEVHSFYEGAKFASDVFRVQDGVLPVGVATIAHVSVTRVGNLDEPEIYVPPRPGQAVRRAAAEERDKALYFDGMKRRFAIGLARDGEPLWGNLDFLDGTRGAHINISGISGVATKTSYALFLLYGLFHSDVLGADRTNSRALIFNVKGEDLLFLDKPNAHQSDEEAARYRALGLPAQPFQDISLWAPVAQSAIEPIPDVNSRQEGVKSYFWSIRRFCSEGLLPFLFTDAARETNQLQFAVTMATDFLRREVERSKTPTDKGWVRFQDDEHITDFQDLVRYINNHQDNIFPQHTRIAPGTISAFIRRLYGAAPWVGHLIRKSESPQEEEDHFLDWGRSQLNVVHIANLHDIAMRFVVGVTLKRLMEEKGKSGRQPLVFVVLDELNKYAPTEGWSPIKEVVLDIAERGRSLGVILVGAQQTASEVERRVVANAAFRVVGRLDTAEAQRG